MVSSPTLPSVTCLRGSLHGSPASVGTPVGEAHFWSFSMKLARAALAQKKASSQHGTRRNLQDLEGFHAFYFKLLSFRAGLHSQSPNRQLAEPTPRHGQAGFARGAMEKHGEQCLLAVEVRLAWLSVGLLFRSPGRGALAREALLIAKAWNPPLSQRSQTGPPGWLWVSFFFMHFYLKFNGTTFIKQQ